MPVETWPAARSSSRKGLSLRQFLRLYGTEEQCEAALEKARLNGTFHAFNFDKYARRYVGGGAYQQSSPLWVLLKDLHGTESQGRGGLWVIKFDFILGLVAKKMLRHGNADSKHRPIVIPAAYISILIHELMKFK